MRQLSENLFQTDLVLLLEEMKNQFAFVDYTHKKHSIILEDTYGEAIGNIRLPLHKTIAKDLTIASEEANVLYISIESGNAAIIVMEGLENVYHTTFSAYMTRKKQGFSQIKYLNKKGKSRAGSRVRLAGTVEFFEKINLALTELLEEFDIDRIAINCSKTLIPYLYHSKIACPFDKNAPELYKIPLHIPQSNFTNLEAAIKKLRAPTLFYEEKYETEITSILESVF
ncbi:MAG: hypothetical protein RIA69_00855 [Cyclobacteriaceae bacterium]